VAPDRTGSSKEIFPISLSPVPAFVADSGGPESGLSDVPRPRRWRDQAAAIWRKPADPDRGLPTGAGLDKFLPLTGAFYLYADVLGTLPPTVSIRLRRCWDNKHMCGGDTRAFPRFRSPSRPFQFVRFSYAALFADGHARGRSSAHFAALAGLTRRGSDRSQQRGWRHETSVTKITSDRNLMQFKGTHAWANRGNQKRRFTSRCRCPGGPAQGMEYSGEYQTWTNKTSDTPDPWPGHHREFIIFAAGSANIFAHLNHQVGERGEDVVGEGIESNGLHRAFPWRGRGSVRARDSCVGSTSVACIAQKTLSLSHFIVSTSCAFSLLNPHFDLVHG